MAKELSSRIKWTIAGGFTIFVAAVTILAVVFPGGRKYNVRWLRWWGKMILRIAGVSCEGIGMEKIPEEGGIVFIVNHQSALDIPASLAILPGRVRMLTKHSLFKIPVFGWALSAEGFVPVNRTDKEKARESLGPAERLLKKGTRVLVFPEGTRSTDGEVGNFKTGGFRLAIETGTPIVPIAIAGAEKILPADGRFRRKGKITLVAGDPIETEGMTGKDRPGLRDETREWIVQTKKRYESEEA
jgi:1-acyl-sn-glycerol-3-phosphate acyltransferase